MKGLISTALLTCLSTAIYAGIGDTTTVSTHNKTKLNWYQAYDTLVQFPDSTHSFNRIMMEFELGKYACDGYNPNNPGEQPGQTGWCADWDYDVHVIACTPNGDTIEIGRLITPYANSNFPRTPANWSHSYWFDVTDYYTLLRDDVTIRIFYAGWSGGFTGSINFKMIEGPRNRDVVGLVPLWQQEYRYGDPDTSINDRIPEQRLLFPNNSVAAEYKMFITGHGGDNTQNCAEFCSKWYKLKLDSQAYDMTNIWRDDCGENFLYPQSGTWIYNRANWCPGDLVHVNRHVMTNRVTPGDSFNIGLEFQSYSSAARQAAYKIAGAAFFYSDYAVNNDVSIEAIIAPTNDPTYYRENPICSNPKIKVKNRGKNDITTLHFKYGLGTASQEFVYNGIIKSEEEIVIELPTLNVNNSTTFIVNIDKVNNVVDEMMYNNTLQSTIIASPVIQYGTLLLDVKNLEGYANRLTYKIKDAQQNVVFESAVTTSGEHKLEYVGLPNGCYQLEVDASMSAGLNFFTAFTRGYFNMYNIYNHDTVKIALPKTDLGNAGLAGNFGSGFKQQFTVTNSQALNINQVDNKLAVSLYPNPANQSFTISHKGLSDNKATVIIYDALGRKAMEYNNVKNHEIFKTDQLANGIYMVQYTLDNHVQTMKLNVLK